MFVYDTGRDLMAKGIIPAENMLPETAFIKLSWALGQTSDLAKVKEIMLTPIVPGEIGTGPTGLMNTVPPVMTEGGGVIVYGHGVFAADRDTFQKPLDMLMQIEENSFREYFATVKNLLKHLSEGAPDSLAEGGQIVSSFEGKDDRH